jgi:hypothetical protein
MNKTAGSKQDGAKANSIRQMLHETFSEQAIS